MIGLSIRAVSSGIAAAAAMAMTAVGVAQAQEIILGCEQPAVTFRIDLERRSVEIFNSDRGRFLPPCDALSYLDLSSCSTEVFVDAETVRWVEAFEWDGTHAIETYIIYRPTGVLQQSSVAVTRGREERSGYTTQCARVADPATAPDVF